MATVWHYLVKKEKKIAKSPIDFRLNDYGWNGRLKKKMRYFLETLRIYDLSQAGLNTRCSDMVLNNRGLVIKRCFEDNLWNIKDFGFETWSKLAEYIKNTAVAQIDTVVTSDIHRLIRANGTLHGKTGLLKVEFPVKELDTFDPFVEAVAFKEGTAHVLVSDAPEFKLSGETFGPYKQKKVELPTAAAVLLILKGRAEVQK